MNLRTWLFRSDRSCLLLLVPLAVVLFSFNLGGRDLWAPDEPDTGEVVREILLSGRFAALTDNNVPFLEKPPLYHWLAAVAARLTGGLSPMVLRLPSSLAALAGVVLLFFLGRDLFGRRAGALAAIVLMTSQKYFFEARWAHVDMLWSVLLLLAAVCFHRAWRSQGKAGWLAGFYLAMGLAVITKGPHGIVLPLLAVVVFLAAGRELSFLRRMGLAWGLPLALSPAVLWLLAWGASGAAYPLHDVLARLMTRFTSGVHHREPFYATLVSLVVIFLPWTVLLPAALRQTLPRRGARSDRQNAFVYAWLLVIFAVFALSVEKRAVYLLPLLPYLALVVGRLWDAALYDWDPPHAERAIAWFLWITLVAVVGGVAGALPKIHHAAADLVPGAVALAAVALVAVVLGHLAHRRLDGGVALGALSGGLVVFYLVAAGVVMPAIDAHKSARPFALRVRAAVGEAPLAMYPDYRPAYVYYTERFIEVIPDRGRLQTYLARGPRVFLLIEERNYEAESRVGALMHVLDREQIGHRAMLLVSNAPEPAAVQPPAENPEDP